MDNIKSVLDKMEAYAAVQHVPIISKEGGQLLQEVAVAVKPENVLELGTAIGYSTLLLSATLAINGKITTIEQDENRLAIARQFLSAAGVLEQIKLISGDAGEVVPQLADTFNLVFIDAAKGQYLDYLHKVMDKLSPGAVVVADNVLFRGWVLDDKATPKRFRTIVKRLKAYLEFVTNDSRFKTTIHHVGDGMAVSYYQGETKQ